MMERIPSQCFMITTFDKSADGKQPLDLSLYDVLCFCFAAGTRYQPSINNSLYMYKTCFTNQTDSHIIIALYRFNYLNNTAAVYRVSLLHSRGQRL